MRGFLFYCDGIGSRDDQGKIRGFLFLSFRFTAYRVFLIFIYFLISSAFFKIIYLFFFCVFRCATNKRELFFRFVFSFRARKTLFLGERKI